MSLEDMKHVCAVASDQLNTVGRLTQESYDATMQADRLVRRLLIGTVVGEVAIQELHAIGQILKTAALQQALLDRAIGNYTENAFGERIVAFPYASMGSTLPYSVHAGQDTANTPVKPSNTPVIDSHPASPEQRRLPQIEIVKIPGFGSYVKNPGSEDKPVPAEAEPLADGDYDTAYKANIDDKVTRVASSDSGFTGAHGRLKDLVRGTRNGNKMDMVAATAAASLLSDSPAARQELSDTVHESMAGTHAYYTLLGNITALGESTAAAKDFPLAPMVLAADVLNNNSTSVLPIGNTTSEEINRVVAAVRDNVEAHYNVETNDEGTVGFLAECRLSEKLSNKTPELQAGLEKRIQHAWSKVHPNEAARPAIRRIYFKVLGITDPEEVIQEGMQKYRGQE